MEGYNLRPRHRQEKPFNSANLAMSERESEVFLSGQKSTTTE